MSEVEIYLPDTPAKNKKRKVGPEHLAVQLYHHNGSVSAVARHFGMSRGYVAKLIAENEELSAIVEQYQEELVDAAEKNVYDAVIEGDMVQSQFVLKTLGSRRGWAPAPNQSVHTIQGNPDKPIEVTSNVDTLLDRILSLTTSSGSGEPDKKSE